MTMLAVWTCMKPSPWISETGMYQNSVTRCWSFFGSLHSFGGLNFFCSRTIPAWLRVTLKPICFRSGPSLSGSQGTRFLNAHACCDHQRAVPVAVIDRMLEITCRAAGIVTLCVACSLQVLTGVLAPRLLLSGCWASADGSSLPDSPTTPRS